MGARERAAELVTADISSEAAGGTPTRGPGTASFPLYGLVELDEPKRRFWQAISTELERAGASAAALAVLDLDRPILPRAISADTVLTQLCGYPLVTRFSSQARVLAAPVYGAEHCDGPTHCGVFVVHRDASYERLEDLRGTTFVFGGSCSNSGMNLPRRALAAIAGGKAFFGRAVLTESQGANLAMVASSQADATCVDAVTYAYVARHRPAVASALRVLATTPRSPTIPFVTSSATRPEDYEALGHALRAVGRSPEWSEARAGLLLEDIVPTDLADYEPLRDLAHQAAELGYPELR